MAPSERFIGSAAGAVRARAWLSRSPEATELLGERLGLALQGSIVIALDGDLGSGKTCFVRGLARGLGAAEPVTSPTYALLQTYAGRLELRHLDAWMEGRERAFLLDGGMEWLSASGVTAIEWAERVADVLPPERLAVRLAHRAGSEHGERTIEMRVLGTGKDADELVRALDSIGSFAADAGLTEFAIP